MGDWCALANHATCAVRSAIDAAPAQTTINRSPAGTEEVCFYLHGRLMGDPKSLQAYPGKGEFSRKKCDEWYQPDGTKVVVCNKSGQRAILEGVQFRPK